MNVIYIVLIRPIKDRKQNFNVYYVIVSILPGQELGFKTFTPPYLAPSTTGAVILQGVNYASGSAGILNNTGKIFVSFCSNQWSMFFYGKPWMKFTFSMLVLVIFVTKVRCICVGKIARINIDAQLDNFANTRQDIISMIGLPAAIDLLRTSIFSITIGSNDFVNNYFTPAFSDSGHRLIPPELFVGSMISRYRLQLAVITNNTLSSYFTDIKSMTLFHYFIPKQFWKKYSNHLQRLYNLGARKIIVVNVGPIGCIPYQRDSNPSLGNNCANSPNLMAQLFNNQLRGLLTELGARFQDSNFLYADAFRIVQDIVQNHATYGKRIMWN